MSKNSEKPEKILERVAQESESLGTSSFARTATRVSDHMSAKDAEADDWAELWGKRIGRGLSIIAFIVLAYWLFGHLTR